MLSNTAPSDSGALNEQGYERLVSAWSDLESSLQTALHYPQQVNGFEQKIIDIRRWLNDLIAQDSDTALYLMFQVAATSTAGYSTSHALVCATLCQLVGQALNLSDFERKTLVHSALTMNVGMTEQQDRLAIQAERPSLAQEEIIKNHATLGTQLLNQWGIKDPVWLQVVLEHHHPPVETLPLASLSVPQRLTRILSSIDRYAAMISPRKSRPGRTVADSLRAIMGQRFDPRDEVGKALATMAGLYPPGTLVKLDTQEMAIVLRRSAEINHPIVAGVIDAQGQAYDKPPVYLTSSGKPKILSSLPWSALGTSLSHRTLVSLGLFTARQGMRQHSATSRG
ncbi:phosphodiesterase [Lampropedia puyangensis]|uniref:Phosphodiesterase n=1 Tax=Lampropedia puyangensis TaxID=1330072 RepID=A0A4S8EYF1_9BURK|nr:phosphodiesterase [Lampropedia puyangensis]THT99932.1 phosphodiesterase [Lampropedia puyangensis]